MPGVITAQEASKIVAEEIRHRNQKIVDPIPKFMKKMVDDGRATVCKIFNVSPYTWHLRPGANSYYSVQACKPGQRYSAPTEIPAFPMYGVPTEMNRLERRTEDIEDVANDILGVGPFKAKSDDLTRWGCFLAAGDEPTEAELVAAEKQFEERDHALIREGNGYHMAGPAEWVNITAQHRQAAARRGQNVPWSQKVINMKPCPVCGVEVPVDAIVHLGAGGCGNAIDEKAVIARKVKGFEHLWAAPQQSNRPQGGQQAR